MSFTETGIVCQGHPGGEGPDWQLPSATPLLASLRPGPSSWPPSTRLPFLSFSRPEAAYHQVSPLALLTTLSACLERNRTLAKTAFFCEPLFCWGQGFSQGFSIQNNRRELLVWLTFWKCLEQKLTSAPSCMFKEIWMRDFVLSLETLFHQLWITPSHDSGRGVQRH